MDASDTVIWLRIPAKLEFKDLALRAVSMACKHGEAPRAPAGDDFQHELLSALGEAFNNIVLHGFPDREPTPVTLRIRHRSEGIELELEDGGIGFEPDDVSEPDWDSLPESGMGMFIIRSFVDHVGYERGKVNVLTLRKLY